MNILLNKHFKILDFNTSEEFNKENIKNCYKKIALACHPDKLNNISDEKERHDKVEKFKEATVSYNYLLKYLSDGCEFDYYSDDVDYFNMFADFAEFDEDDIKKTVFSTMKDLASTFFKKDIKPKSYYRPNNNIIKHNIELPVNISDIYNNKKKKLEITLKNVKEPVMLEIYCGCREINKQYIDDDGIEHDIIIKLSIMKTDRTYGNHGTNGTHGTDRVLRKYNHIECDDGTVNLVTTVEISLLDYLLGSIKKLKFIDGSVIKLNIPAFEKDKIIKKKRGLYNGDLIVNIYLKNIIRSEWDALDKESKDNMIRILKTI